MAHRKSAKQLFTEIEAQGRVEEMVYDALLSEYSRVTAVDWEEVPVDIETFIKDPEYSDFGTFVWPVVTQEAVDIVRAHEAGTHEAVMEWGIGTGKSTLSSLLAMYFVYRLLCMKNPQAQFEIAPDDFIAVLNMARTGKQAHKIVFSKLAARVRNSEWFKSRGYLPDPKVTSELRFSKSVVAIPGNSSQTFALGYNIIVAVLDEANFYEDKSGKDNADEVYDGMQRRVSSRFPADGLIAAISSTTHDQSFTRRKRIEHEARPRAVWYTTRTIVESKPKIGALVPFEHRNSKYMVPMSLHSQFLRNPDKALRDYMCIAASGDQPYMPPYDWLKSTCSDRANPWNDEAVWFHQWFTNLDDQGARKDKRARYVHVDLSQFRDAVGFCMSANAGVAEVGTEKRPKVHVDFMARVTPKQMGGEIDFSQVRRWVYELQVRGFYIAKVTYDGFASEESLQQLRRRGLVAELLSIDKTLGPYETLKEAIMERRVDMPFYELALREVSRLQMVRAMKVDHPAGGSKDCADALAGSVFSSVYTGVAGQVTWINAGRSRPND
jgi:hypothetical protein